MTPASKGHAYGEAISVRIDALAALSCEPGKLTRLYLTPSHRRAADLVLQWMLEAGMTARVDAVGNVIGRYAGAQLEAPALLLGSHIDTVRDAGKFDGNLGVVTAIAVVAKLQTSGQRLPFAIEVVAFGDEEGVRFASTLGGSRALAGTFDAALLDETDVDGQSRRQALIAFGCDPIKIVNEARDPRKILGYVEVHIEQGPVLEAKDLPLGVVTAINGATRGTVTIAGVSGHAGTVPMSMRRDALAAAAEMILAVERIGAGNNDSVATVGRLEIANAAANTVPGQVSFSLDIRSPVDAQREAAASKIEHAVAEIATRRHVTAAVAYTYEAPAAACDRALSAKLGAAIAAQNLPVLQLPSGAGHDGMAFRDKLPFAMLFVRCRGGISHNPAEFADVADIDAAARVLEHFVLALAQDAKLS